MIYPSNDYVVASSHSPKQVMWTRGLGGLSAIEHASQSQQSNHLRNGVCWVHQYLTHTHVGIHQKPESWHSKKRLAISWKAELQKPVFISYEFSDHQTYQTTISFSFLLWVLQNPMDHHPMLNLTSYTTHCQSNPYTFWWQRVNTLKSMLQCCQCWW